MGLFERTMFAAPDDDAGIMIDDFGRALVTWTAMQNRTPVTVAEAAMAFNTSPEIVREAIENASWILVANEAEPDPTKQRIELDGE